MSDNFFSSYKPDLESKPKINIDFLKLLKEYLPNKYKHTTPTTSTKSTITNPYVIQLDPELFEETDKTHPTTVLYPTTAATQTTTYLPNYQFIMPKFELDYNLQIPSLATAWRPTWTKQFTW